MTTLNFPWDKNYKFYTVFIYLTLMIFNTVKANQLNNKNLNINFSKFERPLCFIGNGKHSSSFNYKLKTLKRYQKKISRKNKNFRKNKKLEKKTKLVGTPNWIVSKSLKAKNFTSDEIEFAYFTMTLFAEARNLEQEDIEMVAKVINNRRKKGTYKKTVTELAQFSSWYYKQQKDNVVMLCPSPVYFQHWDKIVKVALNHFYMGSNRFKSTHYFAPYNMVPRYRVPKWAKGKYAVAYGGHIFLVKKSYRSLSGGKAKLIPKDAKYTKISDGKILIVDSTQSVLAKK